MAVAFIREGDQVILKKDNSLKAVTVHKSKKVSFDRLHFFLDNAVGEHLGSVFEVKGTKLHKISDEDDLDDLLNIGASTDGETQSQLILDEGSSQKLSREDIMTMKAEGVKGKDIVDQLVENSSTFKDRTEFSQAKYKNKKRKKHTTKISILKPTTRLIAEMYYHSKGSAKICKLRLDSLSQILTMANVRAHSRLLVVESCHGLVLGAVMDRMGGYGSIVQIHSGDFPIRLALDYFNFSDGVKQIVSAFPQSKLNSLIANREANPASVQESSAEKANEQTCGTDLDAEEEEIEEEHEIQESPNEELPDRRELEKAERREQRLKEECKAREELLKGNMDGLIIVSRYQPCPLLLALLPFLSPSRPFVVFSQYKEPLMECYLSLRQRGGAVNISLSETWWRHYQVLPCRTHPEITMNSCGGYLLTGITVQQGSENKQNKSVHDLEPPEKKTKFDNESP